MNHDDAVHFINQAWDTHIIPALMDYIKIPNKSPEFDKNWHAHGFMHQAVDLVKNWCLAHKTKNMQLEVVELDGRTPLLLIDIPATGAQSGETILLYGHLDKQPEFFGWEEGLSPWQPVLRGDHLYGRGAADDGYAVFASLYALRLLEEQNIPHARCVILIETSEESGSPDLPFYIDALKNKIGTPNLVICLDSGCGNYNQLWLTTSLRGVIACRLKIQTLSHGMHSGNGSGVIPSCFRILRKLLNRIEEESTGNIIPEELYVGIPEERREQAKQAAHILQNDFTHELPITSGLQLEATDIDELILRRTWQPALSVIGIDGLPVIENAGNVTLPAIDVKLSMRLPPTCSAQEAMHALQRILTSDPPYHAKIDFTPLEMGNGWHAPLEPTWLQQALKKTSLNYFGKPVAYMGEGGSIPFMGMLGKKLPQAAFVITGVLGPHSNAHGPNEFLHIPTAKKLTGCIAEIIEQHYER